MIPFVPFDVLILLIGQKYILISNLFTLISHICIFITQSVASYSSRSRNISLRNSWCFMEAFAYIRDHFIKSKTVTIENDDIVCVGLNGEEIKRFPKHIPTAFHSKTSKKPYDLLAIVTCFKYATLPFGEYVTKCRAEKAGMVSTVDKKELIAFLKGDIDTSAQIHSLETDAIPPEKSPQIQPKETGSPSKRQKTESEGDTDRETLISAKIDDQKSAIDPQNVSDKVMQRIFAKERTFRNRTNMLNAPSKARKSATKQKLRLIFARRPLITF
ncbi:hypothetical protein ABG067_002873 [Albugo candida]